MLGKKNKKINSNKFATNKNLTATFIQLLRTKTIKNKIKNKYSENNHENEDKRKILP
jgi:hypothetical protein